MIETDKLELNFTTALTKHPGFKDGKFDIEEFYRSITPCIQKKIVSDIDGVTFVEVTRYELTVGYLTNIVSEEELLEKVLKSLSFIKKIKPAIFFPFIDFTSMSIKELDERIKEHIVR
jgi:hypothetical protein